MSRSVLVDFFRKRFIRIYPMVWLHVCLLVIATYLIVGSFSFLNPVQLLGNALLWLHPLPYSVAPYNGVMWTLPVEVMFYVSLPFLFVVYRRGGVWLLILVALSISIGYRGWVWGSSETGSVPDAWLRTYPGLMFSFVVGFALNHFKFQIKDGQRYVFLALGFCLYVWWRYDVQEIKEASAWLKLTWDLWMAFFIALLLFGFRSPLKGFDWLGSRPMVWLGSMSFGIYLWHLPALRWLPRVFPWSWNTKGGSLLALGVCLVFTFAMSIACQALLDRLLPRFRRSAGQGLCKAGQGVSAS